MQLRIRHTTHYEFETAVPFGLQQVRMTPKSFRNQNVIGWETTVEGGQKQLEYQDFHRNTVELISFQPNTMAITLISEGEVTVGDVHGVIGQHEAQVPLWLYLRQTEQTRPGRGVRDLAQSLTALETLDRLHELSTLIRERVAYTLGASHPDWSAEEAIAAGEGVCQDHAHVFVSAARLMEIPARYVSGYLLMADRQTQTAMHAWAEAHVRGLGWVGFDISNGISPDTGYVRVATGLDYGQAAPVTGTRMGTAGEALSVELEVAQQ